MKSWEILRDAIDRVGVKALALRLNLSTALVYKWCQESQQDDPGASGARNPLDRVREIYELTDDERVVNWLCSQADGFFVRNPEVKVGEIEEQLFVGTQRVVEEFAQLLSEVSRSVENDGRISTEEAANIRQAWERLKGKAECLVTACERGLYSGADKPGRR